MNNFIQVVPSADLFQAVTVFVAIQFEPISVDGVAYPDWAQVLYWLVTIFPLAWLPIMFVYVLCRNGAYQVGKHYH